MNRISKWFFKSYIRGHPESKMNWKIHKENMLTLEDDKHTVPNLNFCPKIQLLKIFVKWQKIRKFKFSSIFFFFQFRPFFFSISSIFIQFRPFLQFCPFFNFVHFFNYGLFSISFIFSISSIIFQILIFSISFLFNFFKWLPNFVNFFVQNWLKNLDVEFMDKN